ncbi:ran GTPase activating protein 1 [Coprinopsis cinerea okayama7|uniref:Ran GTPase activating protein 1 n=1 Tax=Coprinopsis cinerea (strain Okayama-7 / 130 / ATCC MYA-4618 / FGSC 9003) TaxID=240176 RepID=A8NQQ1_COPC7|nr:ran GTPase activating protein 1 [Coprinopsis cinerea okayama7\|eukprot:XP_001835651.1 ran GTPase activating protein 1 [Coprinopsis cinerea okayama7\
MSKTFSLKNKSLKLNTRADIEPWLKDVDPTTIEEVHLQGNTIGVEASQALAEWLSKATNIRIANFADIFTGRLISEIPQALEAICNALVDKTSLVEIDLSDNAFGGRSVDPMVPLLSKNRHFQILKLNNNGLGPAGGAVIANALLESAKLSKAAGLKSNLRTVICGRNRLENGSASAWADAFAEHEGLVEVRMPQNGIRMEGILELSRGLAKNPNLGYIDLQDNAFSTEGQLDAIEAWTKAMVSWPELHTLNLSDCILSTEGEVPTLLTAIIGGSNPKLKNLLLQNNNLETRTFEALAGALSTTLKNVMRMELQWNDVEDEDEFIEEIGLTLKQRGGRLIATDEDEEEEEAEKAREHEAEEEPIIAAAEKEEAKEPTKKEDAADDLDQLAAKLSKVEIK